MDVKYIVENNSTSWNVRYVKMVGRGIEMACCRVPVFHANACNFGSSSEFTLSERARLLGNAIALSTLVKRVFPLFKGCESDDSRYNCFCGSGFCSTAAFASETVSSCECDTAGDETFVTCSDVPWETDGDGVRGLGLVFA